MMRSKGPLLVLLTALMELCWLYSWASFSLGATAPRMLSLPVLCLVFGVAALATRLSSQKGWRVAAVLAVHVLGIVCAAAFTAHAVYYASYPLFAAAWPRAFFHAARAPLDWIVLMIVLAWAAALWAAGATFAQRKRELLRCLRPFRYRAGRLLRPFPPHLRRRGERGYAIRERRRRPARLPILPFRAPRHRYGQGRTCAKNLR